MIRLVYRAYGGENSKNRPPFYSKALALASFVRAAERVGAPILFLNDGPIPATLLSLMERTGEVQQIANAPVGMRASYRAALLLPAQRAWPDDDVVHFSEDDYLYLPDAFTALSAAADSLAHASYFALYGSTPQHPNPGESPDGYQLPTGWRQPPRASVQGQRWVNVASTTSTFGARVRALRADLPIFQQCMVPFRNRLMDHETCLVYQGFPPFAGREILSGRPGEYPGTTWGHLRRYGLAPFRLALNIRATTRSADPHWLYAADPNLACHLETPVMTPGRNWVEAAQDTLVWARAHCGELV